jgi:hypothetical protein
MESETTTSSACQQAPLHVLLVLCCAIADSSQCIQWSEEIDPSSWMDNFLCVDLKTAKAITTTKTTTKETQTICLQTYVHQRNMVVICGSPNPDPEKLLIFTPAWQSVAKFLEVWESRMVPNSHNGPNQHFLFHSFFRQIIRIVDCDWAKMSTTR